MELRQLQHFVAIAEEGSFTRAAHRVNIAQSGLSMSIRALERELGAALFTRFANRIGLTSAGQAFLPEARRTLAALEAARESVLQTQGMLRGTLSLGVMQGYSGRHPVASMLRQFHAEHPGVHIGVTQGAGGPMFSQLVAGVLDLVIMAPPPELSASITMIPFLTSAFVVACASSHRLAKRKRVSLADLAGERFVDMHPNFVVRMLNDRAFAAVGVQRQLTCELDDVSMLLQMVEGNLGIAVVPDTVASTTLDVRFLPLHPALEPWQQVVAFRGDEPTNMAARAFLQLLTRASFENQALSRA